jgi:hypothetical protein
LGSDGSNDKSSVAVVGGTQTTSDVVDTNKEQREIGEKFAALESQVLQKLAEYETSSLKSQQATAKGQNIMTWATVIIAATTITYAVISYFQLRSMKETGADTHDFAGAAQTQANAAQTQANSAQFTALASVMQAMQAVRFADAAKTSADSTVRIAKYNARAVRLTQNDLRARMGVSEVVGFKLAAGSPLEGTAIITNTGKTPALNVRTRTEFQYGVMDGAPPQFPNPNIKSLDTLSPTITVVQAGQQQHASVRDNVPITQEVFDGIKSGKTRLLFRVLITYDDVFTPTSGGQVGRLRTEYCAYYAPRLDALFDCEFGNHAD